MGLYEVTLSISLLGFGIGTMLVNFHMCGIKSRFQHAREECESKKAYVLMMFSLSRPCELLILLCLIASWTCFLTCICL